MISYKKLAVRCTSALFALLLTPVPPLTAALTYISRAAPAQSYKIAVADNMLSSAINSSAPDLIVTDSVSSKTLTSDENNEESIPAAYTYPSEYLPKSASLMPASDSNENNHIGSSASFYDEKRTLSDGTELFTKKWNGDGDAIFTFLPFDFSGSPPDALAFVIETEGEGDTSIPSVNVKLTVETEHGKLEASAPAIAGVRSVFTADTSSLPKDAEITLISLSISHTSSFSPASVAVTAPVIPENTDFSAQNNLNIPSCAVIGGTALQKDSSFILEPFISNAKADTENYSAESTSSDTSTASIFIPAEHIQSLYGTDNLPQGLASVFSESSQKNESAAQGNSANDSSPDNSGGTDEPDAAAIAFKPISIQTASVIYLTVSVSAEKSGVVSTGSERGHTLTAGNNNCILRFSVSDNLPGLLLSFQNTGDVCISSLSFYPTSETEPSSPLASITELTVKGGELKASGRLGEGALSILDKCSLRLYTVPFGGGEPILLGEMKAVSRFVFTVPLDAYPRAAAENYFYISAVQNVNDSNSEKSKAETVITYPRFAYMEPETQNFSAESPSVTGLHGCDPVGIYETGCSNVIIDVYLDRLLNNGNVGSAVSHGGHAFTLNDDYIASIDKDINLYKAANTAVGLRLLISTPMKGKEGAELTIGGNGTYTLRAHEAEATDLLISSVSFLCQRYPTIRSLILFSGIDSLYLEKSSGFRSEWEAADNAGLLMRLAYGAAMENIPEIYVILPFDGIGDGGRAGESELMLATLTSEKLAALGGMPWAVADTTDTPSSERIDSLISACRQTDRLAPSFGILIWAPYSSTVDDQMHTDALCEEYAKLCVGAGASVRAVILSLEGKDEVGIGDYSQLELIMKADGVTLLDKKALTKSEFDSSDIKGSYNLWDFSDSYSACGWFEGSGITSFGTSGVIDSSGNPTGERVLRCVLSNGGRGEAGVLLNSLNSSVDLTLAPYVEFTFTMTYGMPASDEMKISDAELVFVFHSKGGHRAEFHLSSSEAAADDDGVCHVICDLSDYIYAGEINSLGIVIYSDGEDTFELKHVTAHSDSLAVSELPDAIWKAASTPTEKLHVDKIVAAVFILAITLFVSAGVLVRLHRRERK